MLRDAALLDALLRLPFIPYHGTLYRSARAKFFLASPGARPIPVIDCRWSSLKGARFTCPGGPPGLYLSFEAETALQESNRFTWPSTRPALLYSCDVRLDRILDLCNAANLSTLQMSADELACEWDLLQAKGSFVPTQHLGDIVSRSNRFSAIQYPSVRHLSGRNIVVFCDALRDLESIRVFDPDNDFAGHIP
jgi:RES domain-containing protein